MSRTRWKPPVAGEAVSQEAGRQVWQRVCLRMVLPLVVTVGLVACASTSGTGVQSNDLRKDRYFVTEQLIGDMDFPTLQRNLFQHRAACGTAPRFVMNEGQTSYATLIETEEVPASYENVIIADLIQYPESWRSSKRVALRAYSYYAHTDVQARVDRMLNAFQRPGECGGPQVQ